MEISGSTILVTGASGGLGSAIARDLSRRGARLVLTARRREILEALAVETGAEVVVADLAEHADVDRLVERSLDADAIVLNAAVGGDPTFAELTAEQIDASIDVNLRAPIQMATAFAHHKVAGGRRGAIVLVGSLSGLAATPNTEMYNATKFGLRGFSLSLAQDLEGSPVTATLVAPSFIKSAGMFAEGGMELPPGVRYKSPEDVAAAVVRAIESGPAEVYVSPIELRLGAALSTVAPGISARLMKVVGARDITAGR
jgi:short-subunit dehydrogenase